MTAAQATSDAFDAIKPGALIALAHQFESLDMALTPDAALPVMHLAAALFDAANVEKAFLDKPSEASRDGVIEEYTAAARCMTGSAASGVRAISSDSN